MTKVCIYQDISIWSHKIYMPLINEVECRKIQDRHTVSNLRVNLYKLIINNNRS